MSECVNDIIKLYYETPNCWQFYFLRTSRFVIHERMKVSNIYFEGLHIKLYLFKCEHLNKSQDHLNIILNYNSRH